MANKETTDWRPLEIVGGETPRESRPKFRIFMRALYHWAICGWPYSGFNQKRDCYVCLKCARRRL